MHPINLLTPGDQRLLAALLVAASLAIAAPGLAGASAVTAGGVSIGNAEDNDCYRDYSEGGRVDDGCPVQLSISLSTAPGLGTIGKSGMPSPEQYMAIARSVENYPSVNLTVPSIKYGDSYAGPAYIKGTKGNNNRCMTNPELGLTGPDCYEGIVTIEEFTPRRLAGSFSTTLYKMNPDQKTFASTAMSGRFDIPLPVLGDKRRPAGLTYQERFREAFNLMYHMGDAANMASRLSALRDDGRGAGTAGSELPCDCACSVFVRWQNWQVGRSCAPICTLPEWGERRCDLECESAWEACEDLAKPSSGLSPDMQRLVEAMAREQGATSPSEYRAIESLISQYGTEEIEQLKTMHGIGGQASAASSAADVEAILDQMVGKDAPEGLRAAMRPSIEAMSPEERADILHAQQASPEAYMSEAERPAVEMMQQGATSIPANPDWDAETLRYKAAVEQLGLSPDVTEDAVEMFFQNDAPMRQQLWENIERQLARKRQ